MSGARVADGRLSVCLVTNEMYPLHKGGIGRLMYNFATRNAAAGFPVDLHFLVPPEIAEDAGDSGRIDDVFGAIATVHGCRSLRGAGDQFSQLLEPARHHAWDFARNYALSVTYMNGLKEAVRRFGRDFDIVEFPDFGGWATATVEAKRAGRAFAGTRIAARLHSTQGVIDSFERFVHHPSLWRGVQHDMERHLLAHADVVVGHVGAIIDFNRTFYGFDEAWRARARLDFPPIERDLATTAAAFDDEDDDTPLGRGGTVASAPAVPDFIFSSRLQPFKRPDLYLRGAIRFLEDNPDYRGTVRVVSYGWDGDYIRSLEALVPPDLWPRILFVYDATPARREALIARSVAVVPSDYESLCLFAYEASVAGRPVILNRRCLAFGAGERWHEGQNCLMFDGTPADLARAMKASLEWTPAAPVDVSPDAPYWTEPAPAPTPAPAPAALPDLTVFAFGFRGAAEVAEHLRTLARLDLGGAAVVYLLPRARFADAVSLKEAIRARGFRIVETSGFGEDVDALAELVRESGTELAMFVPHGFEIYPRFVAGARAVFARDPAVGVVGGHVRTVDDGSGAPDALRVYAGEMASVALISSRIAPRVSLFRTRLLDEVPFDPAARGLWFEVFARDLCLRGVPMVMLPEVAADLGAGVDRAENGKRLTGGVLLRAGERSGVARATLLAVDPAMVPEQDRHTAEVTEGGALGAGRLIHPSGVKRDFPLVAGRGDGLVLHPTYEGPTVAAVPGAPFRVRRLAATVRNTSGAGNAVEVALALVPKRSPKDVGTLAAEGPRVGDLVAMSEWTFLGEGAEQTVTLATESVSFGGDSVLVMVRVPRNGQESFSSVLLRRVEQLPYAGDL